MKKIYFVLFLLSTFISFAQVPTIGLMHKEDDASLGYLLYSPENTPDTYLLNECGEKVNEWQFSEDPGLTCYLMNNGNIVQIGKDSLEIRDWDDNLIWSYAIQDNGYKSHHDITVLPNGNILCLVYEFYSEVQILAEGKDPSLLGNNFKMDIIIEVEPVGTNNANIVWEWKFKDHLVQDYDNGQSNFGVVADHPELLDLNYVDGHINDYTHCNGIDYNEELDQIIISARHTNEVYVIDHSTTTVEAASHSGGDYGKGGDFLWRWGNPAIYDQGSVTDQKLRLQHDVNWIEYGSDKGLISVFNNGGDGTPEESMVHVIDPDDSLGFYKFESNNFLPTDFFYSWTGDILGRQLNEGKKSGVNFLPSGNFIVTETTMGRMSEINRAGDVLWSYANPVGVTEIYTQYDPIDLELENIQVFKSRHYPVDFVGFDGLDMTPNGLVENENSISESCVLDLLEYQNSQGSLVLVNTVVEDQFIFNEDVNGTLEVLTLDGKLIHSDKVMNQNIYSIQLQSAFYLLKITTKSQERLFKFFVK